MKIALKALALACLLLPFSARAETRIPWLNGCTVWPLGCNFAWNQWGTDFSNSNWAANWATDQSDLTTMYNDGVRVVRWWVFTDFGSSPTWSGTGNGSTCTGLPAGWAANMVTAANWAAAKGMKFYFCFSSFDMGNAANTGWAHDDVMTNSTVQASFINNAVIPICQALKGNQGVFGFDIINEPEWIIQASDNGGASSGYRQNSLANLQAYVKAMATAIHANADQPCSVGSACIKWNGKDYNFWQGLGLDFFDAHFYDWMVPYYDPTTVAPSTLTWYKSGSPDAGKPMFIGESISTPNSQYTGSTSGIAGNTNAQQALAIAVMNNGYSGILPWAWTDSANNCQASITPSWGNFITAYPNVVAVQCPSGSATSTITPSRTPTRTPTPSATAAQSTATSTPSRTGTPSNTANPTFSSTITPSRTGTPSSTANATFSSTITPSSTASPSRTATSSMTSGPSSTNSDTPSATPTASSSSSASPSRTPSPSATAALSTDTSTVTSGPSSTDSDTPSATPTAVGSSSASPSRTPTPSATAAQATATSTATPGASATHTGTPGLSGTFTASATSSSLPTASDTATLGFSPSPSSTLTSLPTALPSFTATSTASPTLSATAQPSGTASSSATAIASRSATPTSSCTALPSSTSSSTATSTPTPTFTATAEPSGSASSTVLPSFTASPTAIAASSSGAPRILKAVPLPNPGPTELRIQLSAPADRLELRVYSPGYTLVGAWTLQGSWPQGWGQALLPASLLAKLPEGVSYLRIRADRGSLSGAWVSAALFKR